MRKRSVGIAVGLGLVLLLPAPNVRAQEAEVSAAVHATLAAWTTGDFETFVGFYHPEARGFFLDGGPLTDGFTVVALQAIADAGFQANVEVTDLDVQVYGRTAMSVGYLVGSLTLPGGMSLQGTWRYSESRVSTDDGWKIIQFHISQQVGASN